LIQDQFYEELVLVEYHFAVAEIRAEYRDEPSTPYPRRDLDTR